MKNTTTGLMEALLQTLDAGQFIKGVRDFDQVTQRQCFLKALRELRKPGVVGLHGPEFTKSAIQSIRAALAAQAPELAQIP